MRISNCKRATINAISELDALNSESVKANATTALNYWISASIVTCVPSIVYWLATDSLKRSRRC